MSSKETSICKTCGKDFQFYRSTLRGKDASFCSRKCIRNTANSGSFKSQGKLRDMICLVCSSEFKSYVNKATTGKYCSKKCVVEGTNPASHLKPMFGSSNPAWKGGVKSLNLKIRHSKEYRIWRAAVFLRDNYICQHCHSKNEQLQADHIKPFSLYPELRFSIDNGRTLCFSCHLKTPTWGGRVGKERIYV